ncbi:MAG: HIT domain-containing protein [bacterium]
MNNECIFCKLVNKEIPAFIVYEDDKFVSFLDIKPVTLGHTVTIPKSHHVWMEEAPDEVVGGAFIVVKKIMQAMKRTLDCDFVEVAVMGEQVPHFHISAVPRKFHDSVNRHDTTEYKDNEEKSFFQKKIRDNI